VHHVIDWYFQLIPGHFLTRSPEAIAAIALDIVDQFNNEPPLARSIPYGRAQLTELGGWRSSIRQASLTAYSDIAVSVRDRQLVILTADPSIGEEPYDARAESGGFENSDENDVPEHDKESVAVGTPVESLDPHELTYRLSLLFDRCNVTDATVDDVKHRVYENTHASPTHFHEWFISLFPDGEMNRRTYLEIMGSAVDAWNAFPHRDLDGRSPLDMIREYNQYGEHKGGDTQDSR
jgi:hypothetical protein